MPIEIKQYSNEHKLLRFLDKDGLVKALGILNNPSQVTSMNPMFLLRSLNYYRELEDFRGDKHENRVVVNTQVNGKHIQLCNQNLDPTLVSCWSSYQSDTLSSSDTWQTFPDTIAAIESTVGDIENIISQIAPAIAIAEVPHAGNWGSLRADFSHHGEVIYYSPNNFKINETLGRPEICFYKREEPYSREKEYRYIIKFGHHQYFSPEIFCVKLKQIDYIKKIYLKKEKFSNEEVTNIKIYYRNKIELI
jgi:hypothetical protein